MHPIVNLYTKIGPMVLHNVVMFSNDNLHDYNVSE